MEDWEAFCEFLSNQQPPRSLFESTAHDAIEFLHSLSSDKIMKVAGSLSTATFRDMDGDHKENPFCSPMVKTFLTEHMQTQISDSDYGEKKINYESLPRGSRSVTTGRYNDDDKEDLFEKCLTTSDVGSLDRLVVTANEDARRYFLLATVPKGTDSCLRLEDEEGKTWLFGFSYLNVSQSYEFTNGWGSFVKEKQLIAGDFVFFRRNLTDSSKLFIGFRRRDDSGAALGIDAHKSSLNPILIPTSTVTISDLWCSDDPTSPDYLLPHQTSPPSSFNYSSLRLSDLTLPDPTKIFGDSSTAHGDWNYLISPPTSPAKAVFDDGTALSDPTATFSETLELTETLKEVETPLQLRLPDHNNTGFDPVLVISYGDNEDSEETYLINYISNELCLRGFTPLRYDLARRTATENLEIQHGLQLGIIIFSQKYFRSRQCMDIFVAIMDHSKSNNLVLLPVFFKVSISDVRGISGSFGKAFSRLENSVKASRILKWKASMVELTSTNGYQYEKGNEVMLAKNIVRDVCFQLNSEANMNLIGMRLQLKNILSLLNFSQSSAPQIVGLWGMAGIGKTSIARSICRTQAEKYDLCYFLADFHRMCQIKGLTYLRDDFFSKIYGEEKVFVDACDTKLSFTRDRFLDKRVLIVLDDVSNARDAEVLVGGFGWFSGGHTIILTSRNRQVLVQCNAKEIYEVQQLSKPESSHLCLRATKQNWKGRMSLISELVNYASGNPLALRVLGSSIQKQFIKDEKYVRRLRQHPPIEIHDAFRRSFDRQDDDEKKIFLDLACFFRGENKDYVVNILDGCGFLTDLGIYGLIDESLISLVDERIDIPNIFQDMGRFVVCQENNEAGKRSRLWDSNDIVDVLTNNSGTEAVEGIFLDASGLTLELSPTVFERMYRLKFLKVHCPDLKNHCKVCLPQGLYSLPDELRLLHWERYPLESLPRKFNPKNLVELNMPYSDMSRLWKGTKNLEKVKRIILSHSQQLTKFPRLSKARNLEHIDLEGCTSLVKVNSSILYHQKLKFLSLKDCSHLQIMPTTVHLESLEVLYLSGCSELRNLQDLSPNLKELFLSGTSIREMPSSIGNLTKLVTLDLENCEKLEHLPPGISNLKAMVTLKLSGCLNLKSLPILDALFLRVSEHHNSKITTEELLPLKLHSTIQESRYAVEEFLPASEYLSSDGIPQESWPWITITSLPSSILNSLASRLYAIRYLCLCNAHLVDIPKELFWLSLVEALDLGGNSFSQIPKSIKELRKLHSLRLRHCKNLISLPELPRGLEILNVHGCVSLESFPLGTEQYPRNYTFSNCFNLSPEVVRKFIGKLLYNVEGMAKENFFIGKLLYKFIGKIYQLEHSNAHYAPFSICIPASIGHNSLINFRAGASTRIEITPTMLKTTSCVVLSVVIEFWDNYRNTTGFGIKCICRKARTDLSPRVERIFHCWAPREAQTVKKDHMFVFGCPKMHLGEGIDHDFLADLITFEFYPVDWQNKLLDDSCTVKRCGVHLNTAAICDKTHSAKRSSSMEQMGPPYSLEQMGPPYKRCRLKRVIETVILSLRKRKRGESVSTITNLSEGSVFSWRLPRGNVFPERPGEPLCVLYMRTGDCKFGNVCKFHHPNDREAHVPEALLNLTGLLPLHSISQPSVTSSFKGSIKKKTLAELKEQESLLLKERNNLKNELENMRNLLKQQRARNESLKKLQLGFGSDSPWANDASYRSFWGLPQRPGQPLCAFYMRTGDCNFGNVCKFHHPIDREAPVHEAPRNPTGLLPLHSITVDELGPSLVSSPPGTPSWDESQKRRDWNTFLQYLKNHKPPLELSGCSGAHVIEFLGYLNQFGKTKVHLVACPNYGQQQPSFPCACPLKQAWGSLDALVGRLKAAYEENGGRPDLNPFAERAVMVYLREVGQIQDKARGIHYEKMKQKRPLTVSEFAERSKASVTSAPKNLNK